MDKKLKLPKKHGMQDDFVQLLLNSFTVLLDMVVVKAMVAIRKTV